MLKTILILLTFLQNCLVNFCNLFSVNLENFSMKGNLKYGIFCLAFKASDLFLYSQVSYFFFSLKKQGILTKLRNNKDVVILRPDKGNDVVIVDKVMHKSNVYELLNYESEFKRLTSDPTKLGEGQLQRYLRKLNNKGYFDENVYDDIYPAGSLPSRLYGYPKFIRLRTNLIYHLLDLLCHQLIVITMILQVVFVNYNTFHTYSTLHERLVYLY